MRRGLLGAPRGSILHGSMTAARLQDAFTLAARVHAGDLRKGTRIPYLAHLLGVCALVLSHGGDEDEGIAALLHDVLEDHPEAVTRGQIAVRFGGRVLAIVEQCTDTPPDWAGGKKPPWRARKEAYVARVRTSGPELLRVSLADKVDNARAILADYRDLGPALWERFSAGEDEQLWYYESLVDAYAAAGVTGALLGELARVVAELRRLVTTAR